MKGNIKNIIILVIIGIVLIFGYFYFFKQEDPEANLVSNSLITPTNVNINTVNPSTPLDDEFAGAIIQTLSGIKNINLDNRIFETLAFKSLIDGTVPLSPDPNVGRINPFAPIGVDANANTLPVNTNPTTTNNSSLINNQDLVNIANDLTLSDPSVSNIE